MLTMRVEPKGLLPYHGIGSGIKRAPEEWPEIGFLDDRDGCLFTATVRRTAAVRSVESSVESSGKTRNQILDLLSTRADLMIVQVARALGSPSGWRNEMKRTTDFQTIRSEGGLLPPDLLRRVLDPKAKLDGILGVYTLPPMLPR